MRSLPYLFEYGWVKSAPSEQFTPTLEAGEGDTKLNSYRTYFVSLKSAVICQPLHLNLVTLRTERSITLEYRGFIHLCSVKLWFPPYKHSRDQAWGWGYASVCGAGQGMYRFIKGMYYTPLPARSWRLLPLLSLSHSDSLDTLQSDFGIPSTIESPCHRIYPCYQLMRLSPAKWYLEMHSSVPLSI